MKSGRQSNHERLLELALKEMLGSRQAPDVSERVLKRLKYGQETASAPSLVIARDAKTVKGTTPKAALRTSRFATWGLAASVVVGLGLIVYPWDRAEPKRPSPGLTGKAQDPTDAEAFPHAVVRLGKAQTQMTGGGLHLHSGNMLLSSGAPSVFVDSGRIDLIEGRTVVSTFGRPNRERVNEIIAQVKHKDSLTYQEEMRMKKIGNWKVAGSMAVCCISGSMLMNGSLIQAEEGEASESHGDVFGVFSWLDRDGNGSLDATDVGPEFVRLADADKNGSVSPREVFSGVMANVEDPIALISMLNAALEGMDQSRIPLIVRKCVDSNGDDRLNAAETIAAGMDHEAACDRAASDEVFAAVDSNGDGSFSEAELGLGREPFEMGDADKNKALSKDEWKALVQKARAGAFEFSSEEVSVRVGGGTSDDISEYFSMFDTNSDGFLDRSELEKVQIGDLSTDALLQAADTNSDGKLSQEEASAAILSMSRDVSGRNESITLGDFASLDADKDGFISTAELNLPAEAGAMFMKALDRDGDGKLSKAEFGE